VLPENERDLRMSGAARSPSPTRRSPGIWRSPTMIVSYRSCWRSPRSATPACASSTVRRRHRFD